MLGSAVNALGQRLGQWRRQSIGPYQAGFNPYALANNAANYSLTGDASDSTYLIGTGVSLIADRSGNSAVNCLATNGGAGSSVTTPTKSVTGNKVFTFVASLSTWNPAGNVTIFSKLSGNDGCELLLLTTGVIRLRIGDGAAVTNYDSTAGMSAAANTLRTVVVTYVDGGSGTMDVTVDGVALGTQVATTKTLTNAAATATFGMANTIGAVYSTSVGSVYSMNPSASAKLAATFVSGGDTYTVTPGANDLGVRICGARDLVQLTAANQPALSTGADGKNIATFDGTNDYLRSAPFSLIQPETVYFTGSQSTWTSNDFVFDGSPVTSTMGLLQNDTTPKVLEYAGTVAIRDAGWAVATRAVIAAIFNGASSQVTVNKSAPTTGDAGAGNGNGFTLASSGGTPSAYGNITFCEAILRSVADSAATQANVVGYLTRKWNV